MTEVTSGGTDGHFDLLEPGELFAKLPPSFTVEYALGEVLGRGGQGIAVKARQLRLKRDVVVKFLLASGAREVTRFLREAELLSRLRHPNVVRLYDFGEAPTGPYLVLELLSGATLASRIREEILDLDAVTGIAADVLGGLEAVHDLGVVHRDIKPDNLFLVEREGDRVKLLDFGIARHDEAAPLTRDGVFVGTPAYAAPELLAAESLDGRTDLYSLGVVLLHMITGTNPFHADQLSDVVGRHFHLDVTRITGARFSLPPALENLVVSLLQKSPQNRPDSASQALEMLERAMPGATRRVTRTIPAVPGTRGLPPTVALDLGSSSGTVPRTVAERTKVAGAGSGAVSPPVPSQAGGRLAAMALTASVLVCGMGLAWRILQRDEPAVVASAVPGPSSRQPTLEETTVRLQEITAAMKASREEYERDLADREKGGFDFFALEPDDFRVPSITPLLDALRVAPEAIRAGRGVPLGLETWLALEFEIFMALARLSRPGSMVVKEEQKYVGKEAILSRATKRGQECVTMVTPILEAAGPLAPGESSPGEVACDVFRHMLLAHVHQEHCMILSLVRTSKAERLPPWVTAYEAPDQMKTGERLVGALRRMRDLPAAWSTSRPLLERRVRTLQEAGRFIGRGRDEVDSFFADEVADLLRRRLDRELNAEAVALARAWLDATPRLEISRSHILGLVWRLLVPIPPVGSREGDAAIELAVRALARIGEYPAKVDHLAIRARSDPTWDEVLVPFATRLDARGRKLVERLRREGSSVVVP